MKKLKKMLAVLLVAVMMTGFCAISSSAESLPQFSYMIKSQTDSTVVLEFSYDGGGFNSFDVKFTALSSNIGSCKAINKTTDFKNLCLEYGDQYYIVSSASNPLTAMFSIASTKTFDRATSICDVTFEKKTSSQITSKDFKIEFSSCVITDGDVNTDVTSKVVVVRSDAGFIKFDSDSISADYKSSKKIEYKSNYSADQIKWESSNEKVATVDDQGNVKMTGKGTATITATSLDGEATAECKVTVKYSSVQWIIIIVLFGWIWYI